MSNKLLLDTDPPVGAPSRIAAQDATGSGVNSASATYPATPTPGNLLIAVAAQSNGSSFALTNTGWSEVYTGGNSGGSTTWIKYFYKVAGASEPTTVTATIAGTTVSIEIAIYEYGGFTGTPKLDQRGSSTGGASLTATTGSTPMTSYKNELVFAAVQFGGASTANTLSGWDSGFNARSSVAGRLFTADQVVSSTSTYSSTVTTTGTAVATAAIIASFSGSDIAPTTGDAILLEDGTSYLLLEDPVLIPDSYALSSDTSTSPLTWNHTIGNGTDRMLVVATALQGATQGTVTAVTYNGVALTKAVGKQNLTGLGGSESTLWLLPNPPQGTYAVSVTATLPTTPDFTGASMSYFNAVQSTTPDATGTGSGATAGTSTAAITTVNTGAWTIGVMNFMNNGSTTGAITSSQTVREAAGMAININGRISVVDSGAAVTAGANTVSYSSTDGTGADSRNYTIAAISLAPVRSVAGTSTTTSSITKPLIYDIKQTPTAISKALKYTNKTTPTAKTKGLQYATKKATALTKSLQYATKRSLNLSKGLIYDIRRTQTAISKSLKYTIKKTPTAIIKSLQYAVKRSTSLTKGLIYDIKRTPTAISKALQYRLKMPTVNLTKSLQYAAKRSLTMTKGMQYDIKRFSALTKSLKYTVIKSISTTKSLVYDIKRTPAALTKSLKYAVKKNLSLTKAIVYDIRRATALNKPLKYTVYIAHSQAFSYNLKYTIRRSVAITKPLKYTLTKAASALTKNTIYAVKRTTTINKSLKYAIFIAHSQAFIYSLKYTVKLPRTISKGLTYDIRRTRSAITKSLKYTVLKSIATTKGLQYITTGGNQIAKSLKYTVKTTPVGVNLVTNGGFETGTTWPVTGWLTTVGTGPVIDSTVSHSGTQSAKLVIDASSTNSGFKINDTYIITVQPNTMYRLRLWVKSDTPGQLQVQIADATGLAGNFVQTDGITWNTTSTYQNVNTTTAWSLFDFSFTTAPGQTLVSIRDFKRSNLSSQANRTFWIDDVSIGTYTALTKSLRYTILKTAAVTRSLQYDIRRATAIAKSLKYTVKKANLAIAKSLAYDLKTITQLSRQLKYAIRKSITNTLPLRYLTIRKPAITKNLSYATRRPVSMSKNLSYILASHSITTKQLAYRLLRQPKLTAPLTYRLKTTAPLTKLLSYYLNVVESRTIALNLDQAPESVHLAAHSYIVPLQQDDHRLHLDQAGDTPLVMKQSSNSVMLQ